MKLSRPERAELLSKVIGEGLDRLSTIDFHARGIVAPIYEAARKRQGGLPLSYSFAKAIIDASEPGRACIVATGFIIRKAMQPETDGLTGAAYLARVLALGLGLIPIIACEKKAADAVRACLLAAGLSEAADLPRRGKAGQDRQKLFFLVGFPATADDPGLVATIERRASLMGTEPCLFLTIERPGDNCMGVPHTTFGMSIGDIGAAIDGVMKDMRGAGIPTFAVGDMGNELGMGGVSRLVGSITPYGERCMCGCGGGVAACAEADYMMMGSISDDACYAIGSSLAEQLGRDDLLPEEGLVRGILSAAADNGAVDGLTAENSLSIDMLPWEEHSRLIGLMRAAVMLAREHDASRPQFLDHLSKKAGENDQSGK